MKTLTPEGLSYPDVPLPLQSVILCVFHPITCVLCIPIRPGLQKIQLHLQHNPPLHSLVVATARVKRRGKNGRCGRRACEAHWPKAGSQPATSTGQLFTMKLKKFLTYSCVLSWLSWSCLLSMGSESRQKKPHVFSEPKSRTRKAWLPDSPSGGQLPILLLPGCFKALDRKGHCWAFEACHPASEHGYVERRVLDKTRHSFSRDICPLVFRTCVTANIRDVNYAKEVIS